MVANMTNPEETEAALRALRFDGLPDGEERLSDSELLFCYWQPRQTVAMTERGAAADLASPWRERGEQILAVLRPFVRWLDANPAKDPHIADARALPTSVLAEALRERLNIAPDLAAHIREIAVRLTTQDNRATDCPIFIVEEKRRTYGFDTDYADDSDIVWLNGPNDNAEADPDEHKRLEAAWQETGDEEQDWTRTAYQDTWEYVTACFTDGGCQEYIRVNKHNHRGELRIYAATSWRNAEFRAVRDLLVAIAGGVL